VSVAIDLSGKRFGRITALRVIGRAENRAVLWECYCDCGNQRSIPSTSLQSGNTTSCGCVSREHQTAKKVPHRTEYNVWRHMMRRCLNPSGNTYKYYGGRGITVCERWRTFANFFADMGERPDPKLTIERRDNNGNYEPGNCCWATRSEQVRNRRPYKTVNFGQKHGNSKLTDDMVMEIRKDLRPSRHVAVTFGVSATLVKDVRSGRQWAHVQIINGDTL
jgi:hypothetical protein